MMENDTNARDGDRFYNWVKNNNDRAKILILGPIVAIWLAGVVYYMLFLIRGH